MATAETPTGTLDPIPNLVKETLEKLDIRSEQIRFAVQSDISSAGSYGEEWFALTDAAIFTVTGEGEVLHYIPYKNVLGIRAEIVVDAGILVLETQEGTVDLIRYSNGCAAKFGFVARFIGDEIEHRICGTGNELPYYERGISNKSITGNELPYYERGISNKSITGNELPYYERGISNKSITGNKLPYYEQGYLQ